MCENLLFITLIHINRHMSYTVFHSLVTTLGVLFFHFLLFCELHIVGISLVTIRHYVHVMRHVPVIRAPFYRGLALSIAGELCWVVDHLACESVSRTWQLHGWWHVLMGACIHQLFVIAVIVYAPGGKAERRRRGETAMVEGGEEERGEALQGITVEQRYGLDWLQAAPMKGKQL